VSGSGTLGWDMMCNLLEAGDNVLVLNTGYFGDKFVSHPLTLPSTREYLTSLQAVLYTTIRELYNK